MSWTPFLAGVIVGSLVSDLLWRLTMRYSNKLIERQREYIEELRNRLGLNP